MLEKVKILKSVTQAFTLRNQKKNSTLNSKEIKTGAEINKIKSRIENVNETKY